jgi:hypothetical protein
MTAAGRDRGQLIVGVTGDYGSASDVALLGAASRTAAASWSTLYTGNAA